MKFQHFENRAVADYVCGESQRLLRLGNPDDKQMVEYVSVLPT
jgi:hypothetical protein